MSWTNAKKASFARTMRRIWRKKRQLAKLAAKTFSSEVDKIGYLATPKVRRVNYCPNCGMSLRG